VPFRRRAERVEHLTRRGGDYIERLATATGRAGVLAREVKGADLRHNLGRLTPDLEGFRARYEGALQRLQGG